MEYARPTKSLLQAFKVPSVKNVLLRDMALLYSQKIWWGIKFGGLVVRFAAAKLNSAKYLTHMYTYMVIPYQTTTYKSAIY